MSRLHLCANCGDPAPNAWLCATCESIKQSTKDLCLERGEYWGHQITGAVYSALTEYRESRRDLKALQSADTTVATPAV